MVIVDSFVPLADITVFLRLLYCWYVSSDEVVTSRARHDFGFVDTIVRQFDDDLNALDTPQQAVTATKCVISLVRDRFVIWAVLLIAKFCGGRTKRGIDSIDDDDIMVIAT